MARVGHLVASSNRGRFALDDPNYGPDLTSGQPCEIWHNRRWLPGHVEFVHEVQAYYFLADEGGELKLQEGLKVRV